MSEKIDYQFIERHLDTLDNLHKLICNRHWGGYTLGTRYPSVIVLGKFKFDECGNFGIAKITIPGPNNTEIQLFQDKAPKVLDPKILFQIHPDATIRSSLVSKIPTSSDKCEECGEGWTIDNIGDAASNWDGSGFLHEICNVIAHNRSELTMLQGLIGAAGLGLCLVDRIRTEYGGTK